MKEDLLSSRCALAMRDMPPVLESFSAADSERHREQAHRRNCIARQKAEGRETETEKGEIPEDF